MTHAIETPERMAIVERVAALGPHFAKRAADYDRHATFPHENWADLKAAGLLGICIPVADGGLGGDFVGYALTSAELGRWCATTALTYNMHVATTLLIGQLADDLDVDPEDRRLLEQRRTVLRRGIIDRGMIHSQPFSEGVAAGATEGILTKATPAEGGYRVTGRKIFASLSGAADIHNIVCVVEGDRRIRFLGVPADAAGVRIEGDWDPLGMRGTDSRNLVLDDVFVPAGNEWLPPGLFDQSARRWPYFYMTLSFSYLGLMRGILDHAGAYLRGEGGPIERRDHPIKQQGWAEMNLLYDRARALCYDVLGEAGVDPSFEALRRAWSSMVTTMNAAPEMAAIAIRICGGRSMLRPSYLEQAYRDARCGATMLPWSVEVCLERLGRAGLYPSTDEPPA
ncbi:MAG: acyl-CoA/acyl-ACP dehydrogenase [Acidimicrobiia bacterium]|nr:acyl-CoA/acyl-ACP dehydrogenase [Acidimicrobiia bacterium]